MWLQTRNAGDVAGIPRFINLKEYVPGDDVTLEDWVVREAARVRQYKMHIYPVYYIYTVCTMYTVTQ